MANHCRKHSPLLSSILRVLLRPSIDSNTCKCKPPFTTRPVCHVVLYVFQYLSIRVATFKAQTLPLSLNVLMLHGNME